MRQSNKKTSRGGKGEKLYCCLFTVNGQAALYYFFLSSVVHSSVATQFVLKMLSQCRCLERLGYYHVFKTLHFITAGTLTLPWPNLLKLYTNACI